MITVSLSPLTLPDRMAELPRDKHDRPVPWFVAWVDGVPDFRVIRPRGLSDAYHRAICWVCGQPRDHIAAFLIGPMCAVNHVSAEPPSHLECATYSARACPFLTTPRMIRRERGLPAGASRNVAGTMIKRNPGVAVVWQSRTWRRFEAPGGHLFDIGHPFLTPDWYAQGRPATRAEVLASIDTGYPLLIDEARAEGDDALIALGRSYRRALDLVPAR